MLRAELASSPEVLQSVLVAGRLSRVMARHEFVELRTWGVRNFGVQREEVARETIRSGSRRRRRTR